MMKPGKTELSSRKVLYPKAGKCSHSILEDYNIPLFLKTPLAWSVSGLGFGPASNSSGFSFDKKSTAEAIAWPITATDASSGSTAIPTVFD